MHGKQIIHRDLKGANLLISNNGWELSPIHACCLALDAARYSIMVAAFTLWAEDTFLRLLLLENVQRMMRYKTVKFIDGFDGDHKWIMTIILDKDTESCTQN